MKKISFISLFFSILLIIATDCICFSPDHIQIITCDYPNLSDHFEQVHSHYTQVDLTLNESGKTAHYLPITESIYTPGINPDLKSIISKIWQPPKIS